MKRLAYLRAEAADFVETFEESVKEMEEKLGGKKERQSSSSIVVPDTSDPVATSRELTTTLPGVTEESQVKDRTGSREKVSEEAQDAPEEVEPKIDDLEGHYKKLWRAIARLTHPDVAGDDEDLLTLYKAASAAHERKSRGELLDVAAELGIQLKDPHPKMLDDAAARCVHYEGMIRKIGDSIAWQWKHAGETTKSEILDLIKRSREKKTEP